MTEGLEKLPDNLVLLLPKIFAADVTSSLKYLQSRSDIDSKRIGLIGHSEGGIIAPWVAAENPTIAFIVMLAGPGVKITQLMEQQSVDITKAAGINVNDVASYRLLYRAIVNRIPSITDSSKALQTAIQLTSQWEAKNTTTTVLHTTGIKDEQTRLQFARRFVQQLSTPWFNYFIQLNPADYLTK
jgi:predicted esterase